MLNSLIVLALIVIPLVLVSYDINTKGRDMLLLLFIILITTYTQYNSKLAYEHMGAPLTAHEAIANLASVYNTGQATLTNLHITGKLTCDNDITAQNITAPTVNARTINGTNIAASVINSETSITTPIINAGTSITTPTVNTTNIPNYVRNGSVLNLRNGGNQTNLNACGATPSGCGANHAVIGGVSNNSAWNRWSVQIV